MSRFIHAGEWVVECDSVFAATYTDTLVTWDEGRALRVPAKPKLTLYLDVIDSQSSQVVVGGDQAESLMRELREGGSGLEHLAVFGDSALDMRRVVKCQTRDKPRVLFRLRDGRYTELQFMRVDVDALILGLLGGRRTECAGTTFQYLPSGGELVQA